MYFFFFSVVPPPHGFLTCRTNLSVSTCCCCCCSCHPSPHLTESEGAEGKGERREGRDGREEEGGGCHRNWESVAARLHLLLSCAELSPLIFKLYGRRRTKKKYPMLVPVMETPQERKRRMAGRKKDENDSQTLFYLGPTVSVAIMGG